MPIELQDNTRTSLPALKLPDVGDTAIFHIVDLGEAQIIDFDTKEPETWPDGNVKMQKVITALLIAAAGNTKAGTNDDPVDPTPGLICTIWTAASGTYHWKEAVKAFRKAEGRGPAVGDVVRWHLEREEAAKKRGANPHKVRTFSIRAPKPDELAGVAAAEKVHQGRREPVTLDDGAAPAHDTETEPF